MLIRAIALSLVLMFSMGTIVSLTTNNSEAGQRYTKKRKKKKLKKYSRAWWKWYRAKKRRQRAIAARKRALRLRQLRLARMMRNGDDKKSPIVAKSEDKNDKQKIDSPALLPTGDSAPKGWKRNQATPGELQFRVDDDNGRTIGTASLSVVGPAQGEDRSIGRNKTLGGVQTSALRRTVIDRMMREQGWVVNDFQKNVGGKTVYVVVAQSPGVSGRVQSRIFYFTEADGRIYSLATNAPDDASDRIALESEKVINSLQRTPRPVQQAELR